MPIEPIFTALQRKNGHLESTPLADENDDASFRRGAYWAVGAVAMLIVASLVSAICSIVIGR